jgi:hypothetical protein
MLFANADSNVGNDVGIVHLKHRYNQTEAIQRLNKRPAFL